MNPHKKGAKMPKGRPFQKGHMGGRPKGMPNKLTRLAKDNISAVYEGLGGIAGHIAFLRAHPTAMADFYADVYPKLLPLDVSHSGDISHVLHFDFGNGDGDKNGDM